MACIRKQRPHQSIRRLRGLEPLEPRLMLTAVPRLVADIAQRPPTSDVVELGGDMYFLTGSDVFGRHLWKADGTLGGTQLVKEVGEGHNSASVTGLTSIGGALYFTGTAGLWRSDGTTQGTQALGSGELVYGKAMDVGGHVVFQASDVDHGFELWTTDGTAGGTHVLKDISPGSGSGVPYLAPDQMALYNGQLFFVAYDPDYGNELWTTDGTAAGTFMLRDITAGGVGSSISDVHVATNGIFFQANYQWWRSDGTPQGTVPVPEFPVPDSTMSSWQSFDGGVIFKTLKSSNMDLWTSDGTSSGTALLGRVGHFPQSPWASYYPDDSIWELQIVNNVAYLVGSDDGHGVELWRSDGTVSGTRLAVDVATGPDSSRPHSLTVMDGRLYFVANDGISGEELWRLDPASGQLTLVRDIAPGTASSMPDELVVLGNTLLFTADGPGGRSLWVSDGTESGTYQLYDPQEFFPNRTVFINNGTAHQVLFAAAVANGDPQLWITDGTSENTMPILDWTAHNQDALPIVGGTNRSRYTPLADGWLFMADDGIHGKEPWFSDGTQDGTRQIKDIFPGYRDAISWGSYPFVVGAVAYFAARDGRYGNELWRSDGTDDGTYMLVDINEGIADSAPMLELSADGMLWFSADDGIHGRELWVSDGTPSGTHMVADINPSGDGIGFGYEIAQVGSELLFDADDGIHGRELWKSDGTAGGASLVADITPGTAGTYPKQFTVLDDVLLFLAKGGSGYDLWRSAGTPETTQLVADLYASTYDWPHVLFNDQIYYYSWVRDGVPGLWRTDGTSAQTQLVLELPPSYYRLSNLEVAGDKLFFTAKDASGQSQLWVSDGSAVNTRVITPPTADRWYSVSYSDPQLSVGDELFFATIQEGELWRSDGTDEGTFSTEIAPGKYARAYPTEFAHQDGALVFAASHPIYGHETWQLPVAVTEVPLVQDGSQVELLLEDGELIVREADVEIFRTAQDQIKFLDFTGNVQVSRLRVDLTGGNPLPLEGISFGESCGAPQHIILDGGDADLVDYAIEAGDIGEISIDGRIIRIVNWLHREVEDNLDAQQRRVNIVDAVSHWQIASDTVNPQHIRLLENASAHNTVITLPVDSVELTLQVAADSQVTVTDSVTGLPDRTNIHYALRDARRIDLQLGDTWRLVDSGQYDGRTTYQISDGLKQMVTFADADAWHNPVMSQDVNGDGHVSPVDVLLVITELNQFGGHSLAAPPNPEGVVSFFDINQDHVVSPIDVLLIIDYLNATTGSEGEGEGESMTVRQVGVMPAPSLPSVSTFAPPAFHDDDVERGTIAPQETPGPPALLTGFPRPETLQRARLWNDAATHWTDGDLEEVLVQLASEDEVWADPWEF